MTHYNALGELQDVRAVDGQVAIRGEFGRWVLFDPSSACESLAVAVAEVAGDD